jgi:hypothetical protein
MRRRPSRFTGSRACDRRGPSALILGWKGVRPLAAEAGILLTSGVLGQTAKSGQVEHPLGILEQPGGIVVRKLAAQRL